MFSLDSIYFTDILYLTKFTIMFAGEGGSIYLCHLLCRNPIIACRVYQRGKFVSKAGKPKFVSTKI